MRDARLAVVARRLLHVAITAEKLEIIQDRLTPVERDALRPAHEMVLATFRDHAVEFQRLRAAADAADAS